MVQLFPTCTDFCCATGKFCCICWRKAVFIQQGKTHTLLADGLFHERGERRRHRNAEPFTDSIELVTQISIQLECEIHLACSCHCHRHPPLAFIIKHTSIYRQEYGIQYVILPSATYTSSARDAAGCSNSAEVRPRSIATREFLDGPPPRLLIDCRTDAVGRRAVPGIMDIDGQLAGVKGFPFTDDKERIGELRIAYSSTPMSVTTSYACPSARSLRLPT